MNRSSTNKLRRTFTSLIAVFVLFSMFSGMESATANSDPATPMRTVANISISPSILSLSEGTQSPVTVTATYSDCTTADVTSEITWLNTSSVIATGSSGVVTALSEGVVQLTAAFGGKESSMLVSVSKAPIVTKLTSNLND